MGKILDKTKEYYKDIEDAKYLVFEDEKIPENVTIFGSNVVISTTGKLKVGRFGFSWGWSSPSGFHKNYSSPEEALDEYLRINNI